MVKQDLPNCTRGTPRSDARRQLSSRNVHRVQITHCKLPIYEMRTDNTSVQFPVYFPIWFHDFPNFFLTSD